MYHYPGSEMKFAMTNIFTKSFLNVEPSSGKVRENKLNRSRRLLSYLHKYYQVFDKTKVPTHFKYSIIFHFYCETRHCEISNT